MLLSLTSLLQHHIGLGLSLALPCLSIMLHALALSRALPCLSITLLLLSHVPCLVSASHCSCSLTCLALSQHHIALVLSLALPCLSMLHAALQCSALSRLLYHVDRSTQLQVDLSFIQSTTGLQPVLMDWSMIPHHRIR